MSEVIGERREEGTHSRPVGAAWESLVTQSFPFLVSLVVFSDALWVTASGKRHNPPWGSVVIPVLAWP